MSSRPSRGAARLAAILDALPDALVLVNANGTVVNANTIALEAFEAPGTALVGRGLLDLLPEFDSRLIPGSMRRPEAADLDGQTTPTRMTARRTDGSSFPVEVTSANLENGQQAYDGQGYTGDELLMIVVRDLSGTVDTEAELARSQRQTEMILRAASEGVVGTDTDGRVVLVNPAAAQILGFRAGDLGGKELHTLVLHSRADGAPFPYDESPLADTLRSGRKHRVRGQVLWSKKGDKVPVDMTTAPVRDGDQLVGAVLTFTDRRPYDELATQKDEDTARHAEELARLREEHAGELAAVHERHAAELEAIGEDHEEELAGEKDRYAALAEREKDRYETLIARHEQLLAVLGDALRGPLDELRRELAVLAADDAGQLWPEANQVLHHLSAGYARITTLVDNVLAFQRLDSGADRLVKRPVMLDAVVTAGVDGAIELIGPGRAQFAVHAPPLEAEVDPERLATALAHLVADVAGVDATGNAPVASSGYMDSTIVVAAAQRGDVVRIEVRGPYSGGDPVHEPIVRGIVRAHGGVMQTHEVPGMTGSAYVLEVPIGGGAGAPAATGGQQVAGQLQGGGQVQGDPSLGGDASQGGTAAEHAAPRGRRRARRSSVDAFLESGTGTGTDPEGEGEGNVSSGSPGASGQSGPPADAGQDAGSGGGPSGGSGRRRGRRAAEEQPADAPAAPDVPAPAEQPGGGTGRRRGRPSAAEDPQGSVVTAAEHAAGSAALGQAVPPGGMPAPAGRRARRDTDQQAVPAALPAGPGSAGGRGDDPRTGAAPGAAPGADVAPGNARGDGGAASGSPATGGPAAGGASWGDGTGAAQGAPGTNPGTGTTPGTALEIAGGRPAGRTHGTNGPGHGGVQQPTGRRARRALGTAPERAAEAAPGTADAGARTVFALPPAEADRAQGGQGGGHGQDDTGQHSAARHNPADDHTPPQPHPSQAPTGRRRARPTQGRPGTAPADQSAPAAPVQGAPTPNLSAQSAAAAAFGIPLPGTHTQAAPAAGVDPRQGLAAQAPDLPGQGLATPGTADAGTPDQPGQPARPGAVQGPETSAGAPPHDATTHTQGSGTALPATRGPRTHAGQPLPAEAAADPDSTQGRAISVRTLGQGVPFGRQITEQQRAQAPGTPAPHPQQQTGTPGTGTPQAQQPGNAPAQARPQTSPQAGAQPQTQAPVQPPTTQTPTPAGGTGGAGGSGRRRKLGTRTGPGEAAGDQSARPHPGGGQQGAGQAGPGQAGAAGPGTAGRSGARHEGTGRSYAIGAPDQNADEGPEPLDGPGGAIEVRDQPQPRPMDDELPPEPLDNPRRLLVWPVPDITTQQALSDRGYRPVIVHSRDEVDAQIAAFPAALFVDPLTGPITRTALQSLRKAAVAAEVPVLVTAGLGQATREAAYGADPAVLLKALAPRDSEQHPPRVLLIEEHAEIALALTATLERRGLQVARAESDADAVTLASQMRPNLVVMDLMQVRRRRAGIVDWLRANGQLNRTPLVVYTAAVDPAELPRLAAGETVLFLAERSTSDEVQERIVDLLAKIGTN